MMAKVKKAQSGVGLRKGQYKRLGRIAESNPDRADKVADRMKERATREQRGKRVAQSSGSRASANPLRADYLKSKIDAVKGGVKRPKAKDGKSFPDLNKDGKITKADILKGRGVIAKKGTNVKKAQDGDTTKVQKPPVLKPKGRTDMAGTFLFDRFSRDRNRISSMSSKDARARREEMMMKRIEKPRISSANKPGGMRLGGGIKKAQAGLKASNKRVGPSDPDGAWTKVQEMNLPPRNVKTKVSLKKDKQLGATKMMKSGGKMKKKK